MRDLQRSEEPGAGLQCVEDGADVISTAEPWLVLIVDDDEDVHLATELALRGVLIEGRGLAFRHSYSAADAVQTLVAELDISTVILDVVMETPDAGLRLAHQIRHDLGREAVRIILRTGQPGYAPERQTVRDFDINDYCTKSELTGVRLFTMLTTAIRSYRQFMDIMRQRDELARLNDTLQQLRAAEQAQAELRLSAERDLRLAHETLEHCVEQRTRKLSEAISELESFNRMVSHDLRGPLGGLAGMSGLIQLQVERGDLTQVGPWLSMMHTQTRLLAELVDDLLNLSRVAGGELRCLPLPLEVAVRDALQMLALSTPAEELAKVTVRALPELPVDAALMRQVFVNLLGNAIKFTRGVAEPRIEVSAERGEFEWLIKVHDNGPGFDLDSADKLFRPFQRLHGARFEGHGIGLTIVRRIVERHGGRVWAESRPGGGATFAFGLPAGH